MNNKQTWKERNKINILSVIWGCIVFAITMFVWILGTGGF